MLIFSHSSEHPVSVDVGVVNFFTISTSLKSLHGFAIKFLWMFHEWTPTKFAKIGVLLLVLNWSTP